MVIHGGHCHGDSADSPVVTADRQHSLYVWYSGTMNHCSWQMFCRCSKWVYLTNRLSGTSRCISEGKSPDLCLKVLLCFPARHYLLSAYLFLRGMESSSYTCKSTTACFCHSA